jgi:hypothetical protein
MTEEKRYKVTINQSIEVLEENEQEAKIYVAENILDLIDWSGVMVEEIKTEG